MKSAPLRTAVIVSSLIITSLSLTNCGGGGGTSVGSRSPLTTTASVVIVGMQVNHIVYDKSRNKIYASVPPGASGISNSVAVIDPDAGTVSRYISVGPEPDALAISDDDKYLYVGLNNPSGVQRIDLATMTAGPTFGGGGYYEEVKDLAVMPGTPATVAVARGVAPSNVSIYDDGVQRPITTENRADVSTITFGASSSELYGCNTNSSDLPFTRMKVSADGVSMVGASQNMVGRLAARARFDKGTVYLTSGETINPLIPAVSGSFSGMSSAAAMAFDATNNLIYFHHNTPGYAAAITAFDRTTYLPVATVSIPDSFPAGSDLLNLGDGRFAFTNGKQAIWITSPNFRPVSSDASLAALAVNHILHDKVRNRIYATVPGSVGGNGNSIAVIDPTTKAVTKFVPVGSEPSTMAMSDDGSTLWVGLQGSGAVRKLDLGTLIPDAATFSIVSPLDYWSYPGDIAVMPGTADTIAVSRLYRGLSPPQAGVALLTSGVQKSSSAYLERSTSIEFVSSTMLLGSNELWNDIERLSVSDDGVAIIDTKRDLTDGAGLLTQDAGLVYSTTGGIIDPVHNVLLAKCGGPGLAAAAVLPDSDGKVYFSYYDRTQGKLVILAGDKSSCAAQSLAVVGDYFPGKDLIHIAPDTFAFISWDRLQIVSGISFTPKTAMVGE